MKRCAALLLMLLPLVGEAQLAACGASSSSVAFGSYNPISPSVTTANGSVTVSCTGVGLLVSYTILLSGGSSGSTANRAMASGGNTLPYNVYTTSGYTTVWNNTTGVSDGFLIALLGTSRVHTVYGRILAQHEEDGSAPVAFVGNDIVERLFPGIDPVGKDLRIVVQLPGVQDTAKAKDILGRTATLEVRMVDESSEARTAELGTGPVPFGAER